MSLRTVLQPWNLLVRFPHSFPLPGDRFSTYMRKPRSAIRPTARCRVPVRLALSSTRTLLMAISFSEPDVDVQRVRRPRILGPPPLDLDPSVGTRIPKPTLRTRRTRGLG